MGKRMEGSIFSRKIKPSPSVVFTDLEDGSAVLLDLNSKFYYSLNDTGRLVWQVFDGEPSVFVESLVNRIVEEYDVSEDEARRDVEEFIVNLSKEGLVEIL